MLHYDALRYITNARDEARVGQPVHRADAVARHEGQIEAAPVDQARREAVVAARHREHLL